jgi:hypothetical protein
MLNQQLRKCAIRAVSELYDTTAVQYERWWKRKQSPD